MLGSVTAGGWGTGIRIMRPREEKVIHQSVVRKPNACRVAFIHIPGGWRSVGRFRMGGLEVGRREGNKNR
jgi:hypothetical protein